MAKKSVPKFQEYRIVDSKGRTVRIEVVRIR